MTLAAHDSSWLTDYHRLTSSLQSALSVDEVEQAYVTNVPGVVHAHGHGVHRMDPETLNAVSMAADVTKDFITKYEAYGRFDDPVMDFVHEHRRPIDSSRVSTSSAWQSTAIYSILADDGYQHSLRAPLEIAGQFCGAIAFARNRGEPEFDANDLFMARQLGEQLSLALERAMRFEATGHRASVLEDVLDHLSQAIIISDSDGQTIFSNRAATTPVKKSGRAYTDMVDHHIQEATEDIWTRSRRVTTSNVHDVASGRRLVAKSIKLTNPSDAAITLIYPTEAGEPTRLPVWDVLTKREQQIAEFVSAGLTTKQIAAESFVSENTVKQHLKRIFAKTDVRNRAELMQRVWLASGSVVPGATGTTGQS